MALALGRLCLGRLLWRRPRRCFIVSTKPSPKNGEKVRVFGDVPDEMDIILRTQIKVCF